MAQYEFHDHALLLNERDHVAVLKKPLREGDELVDGSVRVAARQDIPRGHKIALNNLDEGDAVRKYGQIIGFISQAVQRGDHVHGHNLQVKDFGPAPVRIYPPPRLIRLPSRIKDFSMNQR